MSIKYYLPGNTEIFAGSAFSYADIKYPSNWLTLASNADLTAVGITKQIVEDPPVVITADNLYNYNTNKRQEVIGGQATINVGSRSIPVWVDSDSRGSMTALVVATNINPNLEVDWKGADGDFYHLSTAEIVSLGLNTMVYVQSQFGIEKLVQAKIANTQITTYSQIDQEYD